jgi:hypothetical protein
MKIFVFAEQFRDGGWDVWEHACTSKEVKAVVDSAVARAGDRSLNGRPIHDDFLESARSIFDVTGDRAGDASDGDTRVYCVCVDQFVIGVYEKIRKYSQRIAETHELVEVALQKSA